MHPSSDSNAAMNDMLAKYVKPYPLNKFDRWKDVQSEYSPNPCNNVNFH